MITSFFFFSGGGVQQLDSVAFEEYQLQNLELFFELLIVNFISLNFLHWWVPNCWLVIVIIVQLEECSVWVYNSLALKPCWKYFLFQQRFLSASQIFSHKNCKEEWINDSNSSSSDQKLSFVWDFFLDEFIQNWEFMESLLLQRVLPNKRWWWYHKEWHLTRFDFSFEVWRFQIRTD